MLRHRFRPVTSIIMQAISISYNITDSIQHNILWIIHNKTRSVQYEILIFGNLLNKILCSTEFRNSKFQFRNIFSVSFPEFRNSGISETTLRLNYLFCLVNKLIWIRNSNIYLPPTATVIISPEVSAKAMFLVL